MSLLPIMSPLYNLREICKQVALLEDHLNQPRKRCPDCIRKHFLTIEALFEEAISLDKDFEYGEHLDGKAQDVRDLQGVWLDTKDTKDSQKSYLLIAQTLRQIRKSFAPLCFDVRELSSTSKTASVCPHRFAKTRAEKEDDVVEKLVRKSPKKKPPRKDLRKNRVDLSNDTDLQGVGRGDGGDPDLSRRSEKMAKRVAKRFMRIRG